VLLQVRRYAASPDSVTAATRDQGLVVLQANRQMRCRESCRGNPGEFRAVEVSSIRFQVFPPLAERRMPAPYQEPVPVLGSPVPARITLARRAGTVIAPMLNE